MAFLSSFIEVAERLEGKQDTIKTSAHPVLSIGECHLSSNKDYLPNALFWSLCLGCFIRFQVLRSVLLQTPITELLWNWLKYEIVTSSLSWYLSDYWISSGSEVQMSAVDCGEWTDLCAAQSSLPIPFQPITAFPCVLLLRPKEPAQLYRGMLGSEALHRFILLWVCKNTQTWIYCQFQAKHF